ncbi:MAG: hypothetical protein HC836_25730 [Richelia sp. RM2_1_2]|nr:hypothetical protein [Richelia sp. RM2_1_2]
MVKEITNSCLGLLYEEIYNAHLERNDVLFWRRLLKLSEEVGELSEAYLFTTANNNYKNKTYHDVREELADLVVMALDLSATRLPGEEHLTNEEFEQLQLNTVKRKLAKWQTKK